MSHGPALSLYKVILKMEDVALSGRHRMGDPTSIYLLAAVQAAGPSAEGRVQANSTEKDTKVGAASLSRQGRALPQARPLLPAAPTPLLKKGTLGRAAARSSQKPSA